MPETGLITDRFNYLHDAAGQPPDLNPGALVQTARLFRIEDQPAAWLAWYEGNDLSSASEVAASTPGATDLERFNFVLKRDVANPEHHADQIGWLYVVHTDVPDDVAAEYNQWYDEEHLPRLARVPGIVRARRFVASNAHPRYFTAYDLADRDAFSSPKGLEARKTPWTERMRSVFSNTRRFTARLISTQAHHG